MEEPEFGRKLSERMWKAEGLFAEAKQNHGLTRARYRGRSKVQIQAYLIAMAQNLKRLVFLFYYGLVIRWFYRRRATALPPSRSFSSRTFSTGPVTFQHVSSRPYLCWERATTSCVGPHTTPMPNWPTEFIAGFPSTRTEIVPSSTTQRHTPTCRATVIRSPHVGTGKGLVEIWNCARIAGKHHDGCAIERVRKVKTTIMSRDKSTMKIVVIGGTGLIGRKLVSNLRQRGHEAVAASRSSGVNSLTGEGLADALAGAAVVIDVANSPSFEDKAVLEFFQTSGRNLLAAEATAGVGHHIALSVVGTDRLLASGYFRAKMAQENLIKASSIPYTIVRATQFFEFVGSIAESATDGQAVRLPPAMMQPIVSDDVAAALAEIAVEQPLNGTIELAGPEPIRMDELVRRFLSAKRDARKVITDVHAGYFGTAINDQSLTPGNNSRLGPTRFEDWLSHGQSLQA